MKPGVHAELHDEPDQKSAERIRHGAEKIGQQAQMKEQEDQAALGKFLETAWMLDESVGTHGGPRFSTATVSTRESFPRSDSIAK